MTEGEATSRGSGDRSLLRIPFCLKCGYDLSGHGEGPRCPECGEQYEEGMIVLNAHKAGSINPFMFAAVFLSLGFSCLPGMINSQRFNLAMLIGAFFIIAGLYCLYDGFRNKKLYRSSQKLRPYIFTSTHAGMPPNSPPKPLHHWKRIDRIAVTQHPWWKSHIFKSQPKFWRLKVFWKSKHFELTAGNVDFIFRATPEQSDAVRQQLQKYHAIALRESFAEIG